MTSEEVRALEDLARAAEATERRLEPSSPWASATKEISGNIWESVRGATPMPRLALVGEAGR